jgi:hypothetical protein
MFQPREKVPPASQQAAFAQIFLIPEGNQRYASPPQDLHDELYDGMVRWRSYFTVG